MRTSDLLHWSLNYEGAMWSWRIVPTRSWRFAYEFSGTEVSWQKGQIAGGFLQLSWRRGLMMVRHSERSLSFRQ